MRQMSFRNEFDMIPSKRDENSQCTKDWPSGKILDPSPSIK